MGPTGNLLLEGSSCLGGCDFRGGGGFRFPLQKLYRLRGGCSRLEGLQRAAPSLPIPRREVVVCFSTADFLGATPRNLWHKRTYIGLGEVQFYSGGSGFVRSASCKVCFG